jgi:ABC-type dipeptide/oligopeptide/nickel transport system permease component
MRMITRRFTFYLVTAVVAITINFFIPRLMPGNPALAVLGRVQAQESKQAIAALELQYGVLTKTGLWGQYVQYWSHLLHGNLGTSLNFYPASVGGLIRAALPWTVALVGIATVISFVLGTLLGVAAAWRRGSWLDGLLPAMTFFQAAPYFFVAILAVALFATKLGWFPPNSGALLPSVAGFSLAIGFIVSGALLTEIVFSYPGVGYLLFTAIGSDDYPLLQGIFLIITLAVLLANLAADFVYAFLDPRTRQEA